MQARKVTLGITIVIAGLLIASFSVMAQKELLKDDFEDGDASDWTIFDDGARGDPDPGGGKKSVWYVGDGKSQDEKRAPKGTFGLDQNVLDGKGPSGNDPNPGSYAIPNKGSLDWTDYTVSVDVIWRDDDHAGIMFRYIDPLNYYRFFVKQEDSDEPGKGPSWFRIDKFLKGAYTELIPRTPIPGVVIKDYKKTGEIDPHNLKVTVKGSDIEVFLDGKSLGKATDADLKKGTVGLYTHTNPSSFDNFLVVGIGVPTSVEPKRKLTTAWGIIKAKL